MPKNSHFTRQLDQFDNVEYVQDVENRFEEPGKEISAMPYISKYIYNKLNKLQKHTQTVLSTRKARARSSHKTCDFQEKQKSLKSCKKLVDHCLFN